MATQNVVLPMCAFVHVGLCVGIGTEPKKNVIFSRGCGNVG
jgi:hypothetical protein